MLLNCKRCDEDVSDSAHIEDFDARMYSQLWSPTLVLTRNGSLAQSTPTYSNKATIGDAEGHLEDDEQPNLWIEKSLAHLGPSKMTVFHAHLISADSIDRFDSFVLGEEAC